MNKLLPRLVLSTASILLGFGMMEANPAQALNITGTLTADDHYGLYYGHQDATGLTFVGRNEIDRLGSPGLYAWSLPETYNFNVGAGDYLYVLAWDFRFRQSWIGEFQGIPGGSLLSNTTDWEYFVSSSLGNNPGHTAAFPSLAAVATDIASATWATPQASAPQGSFPWGTIPGISSSAQFIWSDTLDIDSTSDNKYVIFRTKLPVVPNELKAVPEPTATLGLLTLGILATSSRLLRKQK